MSLNKTEYMIEFGDAKFSASDFRISADSQVASGQRGASDSTIITLEAWVDSTASHIDDESRKALFKASFRPQNQAFQTLTAEVRAPGSRLDAAPLCTYTFQRGWVTHFREYRSPGMPDIQVYVKFRALFSQDATTEVKVE